MSTELVRDRVVVALPAGVSVRLVADAIEVAGPRGTVRRRFPAEALGIDLAGGRATLTLTVPWNRRRSQALLKTWGAHLRNLAGATARGAEARLKIVAAHFPMKVAAREGSLVIENFLGEKHPRSAPLVAGVTARVDGDFVVLEGHDVEAVGQSSANIERATRIRNYDPRVFQDGIYIVERAHLKETN